MACRFLPLVFVGTGVFAEMLIKKILYQGFVETSNVIATVRRKEKADYLKKLYGIRVETDNAKAIMESKTIFICVKPQDVYNLAKSLGTLDLHNKLLVSIVAGISLAKLSDLFGTELTIRANPNPQGEVGFGYTAIATSAGVDDKAKEWIKSLFECLGEVSYANENIFDAVSAISGITHVLYFYDCLVDAGIYLGLPKQMAERIAYRSVAGTMMLLNERKCSSADLITEALTPGGVSVEKFFIFEKHGLRGILIEAMRASRDKASLFNIRREDT